MPTVSYHKKGEDKLSFEVTKGDLLFDSCQNRGLSLPHGCLAGSCGSCRVEIISGEEMLKAPGTIERDTISSLEKEYEEGTKIRLACRARVQGDVEFKTLD